MKVLFQWQLFFVILLYTGNASRNLTAWNDINLPPEHMIYFFNNNPALADLCREHKNCPYKKYLKKKGCWGYEKTCLNEERYSHPVCNEDSRGWALTKKDQINAFFTQGDFGYIKERKQELSVLCAPEKDVKTVVTFPQLQHTSCGKMNTVLTEILEGDTILECARYTRYCKAQNLMFDFKTIENVTEPLRYRDDVIRKGQVGGHCKLNKARLRKEGEHKSPLQSWYAELEHFTEFPYQTVQEKKCDMIIARTTFIMKLDASVNMYHHFCDFLNLYATLHLHNIFTMDVNILIWDTVPYRSNFGITWQAFTKHPLLHLGLFRGKKVCFKDVIFPLLPRMIFGMYYNMPLIPGCHSSGLFHAFSRHILHKLDIKQDENAGKKIRITLLSRGTTYRQILNEDELIDALRRTSEFIVRKETYNRRIPFTEQLKMSHNTDIFIGIHGAGLTHMLFQPDWGAVFEIYNCDDKNCYADLARLRGLYYITWENTSLLHPEDEGHHPTLGAHAKFTNYSFDVEEFLRLVMKAVEHVKNHSSYKKLRQKKNAQSVLVHNEL